MTEREIFLAALEKDDPTERAAYLDQACGADAPLRQRVEALLRSHERAAQFMEVPVVEQLAGDGGGLDFLAPSQKPGSLGCLGHYEALEVVGRGGMGVVFRAFDTKLHRVVAIKALAPQLATSSAARQRFVREARAAAAVTHDNVLAIHAVEDQSPVPYLVMQFIDGPTLQKKLDRTGQLPLKEILRIGLQIAEGLAAAHRHGLVHRDVKPANILLENGVERVKLTDFGLARAGDDARLTQSGVVAGTPLYMSPEQAQGEAVDFRSDLFSLGSVLYAMCSGRPPFRAPTAVAVLKRVCEAMPRPIREINPELPTLREKRRLRGHTSTVLTGAWRADGRLLATAGCTDGTVRLGDLDADPPRCQVLRVIPPDVPWLHAIAFSPEGRHLAVGNPDGTVYVLRLAQPGEVFRAR